MKQQTLVVMIAGFLAASVTAEDRIGQFSAKAALQNGYRQGVIAKKLPVTFKGEPQPAYATTIGTYKAKKRTNAFGKSDRKACEWVFLSAIKGLLHRAEREGATALIDVTSFHNGNAALAGTQFTCRAGTLAATVTLQGTLVK